jgi:ABC-type glycerol-3-phosphate transport system substrate-binding protein
MADPILFSMIGEPTPDLLKLLDEFQQIRNVQVKVEQMSWDDAWAKLLSYALSGKGPDVSHVGSTWVSSLVGMNAVRKFTDQEVEAMGGSDIFISPAWQSATIDDAIYSIPWSSFTFLVFYRRDHLESAGIQEDHAFDTAANFHDTVKKLKEKSSISPLILPSGKHFLDRVHIAASWIWGADGDYFSNDGRHSLLTSSKTHAGLRSFFELYRLMSPADYGLDYEQTLSRFVEGSASVVIADCSSANMIQQRNPGLTERIGVHPLPGAPFVSGDNLIIWQDTHHAFERERIALDLVSFLVSETAQRRFCQSQEQFPVRHDSFDALSSPIENYIPTLQETFEHGRSYKPIRLWSRYEQQLSFVFDDITTDVITKADLPIDSILEIHLSPMQQRFSLLLGDGK